MDTVLTQGDTGWTQDGHRGGREHKTGHKVDTVLGQLYNTYINHYVIILRYPLDIKIKIELILLPLSSLQIISNVSGILKKTVC